MIRILYVIDVLDKMGGTERQLCELLRGLSPTEFSTAVAVLYGKADVIQEELPGSSIPVMELGIGRVRSLATLRVVARLARRIRKERFDIVQAFQIDANLVGVAAARLGGAGSVVLSRRDLGYWYTPSYLRALRVAGRWSDRYLVNSNAVKERVAAAEWVDPAKIVVIPNGVRRPPIDLSSAPRFEIPGVPPDRLVVGVVANLREVKRIDRVVEVAAGIRRNDTHFVVVGRGPLRESLEARARAAGIGDRFHVIDPGTDVHSVVRAFDVAVLTSESEGLSNALIECLLCGVPCIAFDVGGNGEVIRHGSSGYLVPPYDVDAMRVRVEELLSDRERRTRFGELGRNDAAERFSLERMLRDTEAFYRSLVR